MVNDPTSQVYFHPDTLGTLDRIAMEDGDNRGQVIRQTLQRWNDI
jgi:hypothetical protein